MSYEPKDVPSLRKFQRDFDGLESVLRINKLLSKVGLGSKKIRELDKKFDEIKKQKKELEDYPTKYNRYFSDNGWIAHESLDLELIKQAVNLFEQNKTVEAQEAIFQFYSPDEIEKRLFYLKHLPEFHSRFKFIEFALNDYKEKRYYSCTPILLIVIDGLVQDYLHIGFHANKVDLNVWDSITSTDTGIQVIKAIFQKSRNKTTEEQISLPYRNGILHGRDLGYDNYEVAAKSWAFLFYIRDWLLAKKSEKTRLDKFEEENRRVTWKELFHKISALEETKKAIGAWKARNISQEYLDRINNEKSAEDSTPEKMVLLFLESWKAQNYGQMAKLFSDLVSENFKGFAGEIRRRFQDQKIDEYSVVSISDEAASITEILVKGKFDDKLERQIRFRCIYESGKNSPVPRDLGTGEWRAIVVE